MFGWFGFVSRLLKLIWPEGIKSADGLTATPLTSSATFGCRRGSLLTSSTTPVSTVGYDGTVGLKRTLNVASWPGGIGASDKGSTEKNGELCALVAKEEIRSSEPPRLRAVITAVAFASVCVSPKSTRAADSS